MFPEASTLKMVQSKLNELSANPNDHIAQVECAAYQIIHTYIQSGTPPHGWNVSADLETCATGLLPNYALEYAPLDVTYLQELLTRRGWAYDQTLRIFTGDAQIGWLAAGGDESIWEKWTRNITYIPPLVVRLMPYHLDLAAAALSISQDTLIHALNQTHYWKASEHLEFTAPNLPDHDIYHWVTTETILHNHVAHEPPHLFIDSFTRYLGWSHSFINEGVAEFVASTFTARRNHVALINAYLQSETFTMDQLLNLIQNPVDRRLSLYSGGELIIETLARHFYPSNPDTGLGQLLYFMTQTQETNPTHAVLHLAAEIGLSKLDQIINSLTKSFATY